MFDPQHTHGNGGLFRRHGIEVADGQQGYIGPVKFANDRHVAEGAGIASVIELAAILELDHEACRIASIRSVFGARGMNGVRHCDFDAINVNGAALIDTNGIFNTL